MKNSTDNKLSFDQYKPERYFTIWEELDTCARGFKIPYVDKKTAKFEFTEDEAKQMAATIVNAVNMQEKLVITLQEALRCFGPDSTAYASERVNTIKDINFLLKLLAKKGKP